MSKVIPFGQRGKFRADQSQFPTTPFQRQAFGIAGMMRKGEKFILREGSAAELNDDRRNYQGPDGGPVNVVTADLMYEIASRPEWHKAKAEGEKDLNFSMAQVFRGYFENGSDDIVARCHSDVWAIIRANAHIKRVVEQPQFGKRAR